MPKSILDRKKQGFVGPDAYYMDIEWYRQQFAKSRLIADGIIQKKYIDNLLKETYNWKLWKILYWSWRNGIRSGVHHKKRIILAL